MDFLRSVRLYRTTVGIGYCCTERYPVTGGLVQHGSPQEKNYPECEKLRYQYEGWGLVSWGFGFFGIFSYSMHWTTVTNSGTVPRVPVLGTRLL